MQYSKDSPNAFFRKIPPANPPAGGRKGGEAAPMTISSFSLAANYFTNLKVERIFLKISFVSELTLCKVKLTP